MLDIINFEKELNTFPYMFDSDNDFQKSKNDFVENEFIKSFSDGIYVYDALADIKVTYSSNKDIFKINVSAVGEKIRIEYLLNLTTDEIQSNVSFFEGEYTDSDKFAKCYDAYKNLDSMIIIFIKSNIKTRDEVVNVFIEKLKANLLSDDIKIKSFSYNVPGDTLFINIKDFQKEPRNFINFQMQVSNFTDFIKGENLYYNINFNNAIYSFNNKIANFINSIVKNIEKLRQ
jgi:hypothetical protein